MRAVADYDVDRAQVQRRRRQSRALLIARKLPAPQGFPARLVRAARRVLRAVLAARCGPRVAPCALAVRGVKAYPGGHCAGVPPLPIPNREVKPGCADGTAPQCGRVGGRRLYMDEAPPSALQGFRRASFFVSPRRVASPGARRGVLLPAMRAARRGRIPPVGVARALHFSKVLALHSKKVLTLHSNGFDACRIFLWNIVGSCRFLQAILPHQGQLLSHFSI